jgi:hypothetical protein
MTFFVSLLMAPQCARETIRTVASHQRSSQRKKVRMVALYQGSGWPGFLNVS